MRVYTGDWPGHRFRPELRARGWGIMSTSGRPPAGFPWAFDNGAFGAARAGRVYDGRDYFRRLRVAARQPIPPDFAVIPDDPQLGGATPYGAMESLFGSLEWLYRLPLCFPWYLAVQDGMTPEDVAERALEDFPIAGLFLGGSDAFKATAGEWAALAQEYGIGFHYARASSARRIRQAIAVGATSMDSAQMLRTRGEFRVATRAYFGGIQQPRLPSL